MLRRQSEAVHNSGISVPFPVSAVMTAVTRLSLEFEAQWKILQSSALCRAFIARRRGSIPLAKARDARGRAGGLKMDWTKPWVWQDNCYFMYEYGH